MPGSADNRIAADAHVRLRYFCSPYHQDRLLFPIIGQLEHAAGFAATIRLRKAEKLAELLDAREHADDDLALFADLLSLPEAAQGLAQLSPEQKKEKTFDALLRRLESLASQQPLLMVFEDVHRIDAGEGPFSSHVTRRWRRESRAALCAISRLSDGGGAAFAARTARGSGFHAPKPAKPEPNKRFWTRFNLGRKGNFG